MEISKNFVAFSEYMNFKSEEEKRWSEDPLTGKNLVHLLSFSCTIVRQYDGNFDLLHAYFSPNHSTDLNSNAEKNCFRLKKGKNFYFTEVRLCQG